MTLDDQQSILCPNCGYDLRAATTNRCSECGLELDPNLLRQSGIAWAHRKQIGRIRAFVKTIWQISIDSLAIRYELAKPQDERDGRSFSRVVGILLSALMIGVFVAAVQQAGGFDQMQVSPEVFYGVNKAPGLTPAVSGWVGPLTDAALPWLAGIAMRPVMPVCFVLLAFYLARATGTIFHVASQPAAQQQRVRAMAHYLAGPILILLMVLVLAVAVALADDWLTRQGISGRAMARFEIAATIVLAILLIMAPLTVLVRSGQWAGRARHAQTTGVGWLAVMELLGLWIAGVIVLLGVVPWCAGMIEIAVDSMRR